MRLGILWFRLRLAAPVFVVGLFFGVVRLLGGGFVQTEFAIGLWVPPRSAGDFAARYREIAGANFNLVVANSVPDAALQLELCHAAGLHAVLEVAGPVEQHPQGEGCWGYHLMDEPGAGSFAGLAQRVELLRRFRPGRLAYINLFPNYASPAQLGTQSYEEYVHRFVTDVKPDVLCMDHYPFMRPDRDTREAYLANLETFRQHANAAGIPFWNYFNSMPFGEHSDPTEAQIRWQVNASLAHGAKGVLYFCYWTPGKGAGGKGEFPKGGAILTAEGIRTRHYDEARRINGELKNLGPTLMNLTGNGVVRVRATASASDSPRGTGLVRVGILPGDPPANLLLGSLIHRDGRRALMVVNHDHSYTCWPTLRFEVPVSLVREVDRNTGLEVIPVDSSPELEGFQCSLGAGDARLFLFPRRE